MVFAPWWIVQDHYYVDHIVSIGQMYIPYTFDDPLNFAIHTYSNIWCRCDLYPFSHNGTQDNTHFSDGKIIRIDLHTK